MKRFNLLFDKWIPVKKYKDSPRVIAPYEIAQKDIYSLDMPRPDFNAALMQFLIGLIQTVLAPTNPEKWRTLFRQPPSEDELKSKFISIEDFYKAFYLDGDGRRFMQDRLCEAHGEKRPIEEMVFGAPGESGKIKNQDHFVKQNYICGLCYSCTASALIAANIFAEDGGRGYFQSMRGNGFVSNLVQIDGSKSEATLWKNIWLNILVDRKKDELKLSETFLWIDDLPDKGFLAEMVQVQSHIKDLKTNKKEAKKRDKIKQLEKYIEQSEIKLKQIKKEIDELSEKKVIYPESSEFQVFWAWMRRYFITNEDIIDGKCSLCSNEGKLFTTFFRMGKGLKYPKEIWQNRHPFSPAKKFQRERYDNNTLKYKDKMLAINMTSNGLPYTYWQDFMTYSEKQVPAIVVSKHLKKMNTDEQLIIWAFGYAMDSNAPIGWYESITPLYLLASEKQKKEIEGEVDQYIKSINAIADSYAGLLVAAIRTAWFGNNREKNKDKKKSFNKNLAIQISKCLLGNTEKIFFDALNSLYENASQLTDENKVKIKTDWYKKIRTETKKLFNLWAFKSKTQTNPRRIAIANNRLMEKLNSEIKWKILGLPKEV